MIRVFYSHSLQKYDTPEEQHELRALRYYLGEDVLIRNPNGYARTIEDCFRMINDSDILFVTEYCGFIGRGVYCEILQALDRGMPIFCYRRNYGIFEVKSSPQIRPYDPDDWKIEYARIRKI